jgi:hypothetical protein
MDGVIRNLGGLVYLLLPVFFAAMIGIPIGLLLWMVRRRERERARTAGFEVKRSTVETPVSKAPRDE